MNEELVGELAKRLMEIEARRLPKIVLETLYGRDDGVLPDNIHISESYKAMAREVLRLMQWTVENASMCAAAAAATRMVNHATWMAIQDTTLKTPLSLPPDDWRPTPSSEDRP